MTCGIYVITSPSGKQYVGSSVDIKRRWSGHKSKLRRGAHHSPALQAAWDKYGEGGLHFALLTECLPTELLAREQRAMDAMCPAYNIARFAGHPMMGANHTDEAKEAISAARRGKSKSAETRQRMSDGRKGMKFSDEHRAAISRSARGGTKNRTGGNKHTDQHKANISASMKGRKKSPEAIANMTAARRARLAATGK